ncbi:MAG: hypothetical protein A4S09_03570 [Proteobacteria bacterium SG_bin7]|nr:MAG: hypothetical protein A4S09_03570 [Proteobacteria bacterium SG_bin7]
MPRNTNFPYILFSSFIFFFVIDSHAAWFWESGELVCENRVNGENCWWQESNPAPDQYDQIQTELYNMYSKTLRSEDSENVELQLLQHRVMKLVEETATLLQQMKMNDPRRKILDGEFLVKIQILQRSVGLFTSTVQTTRDYWSSRGPKYIDTLRKDAAKAKCLSKYLEMALRSDSEARMTFTESGFLNCNFMVLKK